MLDEDDEADDERRGEQHASPIAVAALVLEEEPQSTDGSRE